MDWNFVLVLAIGILATLSLNIGKAVQKMKVFVLKKGKDMIGPEYRKDFGVWCIGISMTIVASVLFIVAQKMTDKTSIVASLNGVGLVGLAIFSYFVLKEKVGKREWGAIALIVVGTAIVSYFNVDSSEEKKVFIGNLWWCSGIATFGFAVLLFILSRVKKGQAFVYAAIAGTCLGIMQIFYHVGPIVTGDNSMVTQFGTVYPWAGIMIGNMAFVFTQFAFFHGSGIYVVPTVNSFMIIVPMIVEIFVFGTVLAPVQYAGAAVIIVGVILLTSGGGHIVEDGSGQAPSEAKKE
ncbi:MAG TPA: DMT family transporter [bacterium]|nr:DMT family transporter [bacterium]